MTHLLVICGRCERSSRDCRGACLCTVDGKDHREHAAAGYCPLGKYQLGIGDWIAIATRRFKLQRWVDLWAVYTGKPCDCPHRQVTINGRWRGIFDWLLEWPDAFGRADRRPPDE